jgi:hypothetical protein
MRYITLQKVNEMLITINQRRAVRLRAAQLRFVKF